MRAILTLVLMSFVALVASDRDWDRELWNGQARDQIDERENGSYESEEISNWLGEFQREILQERENEFMDSPESWFYDDDESSEDSEDREPQQPPYRYYDDIINLEDDESPLSDETEDEDEIPWLPEEMPSTDDYYDNNNEFEDEIDPNEFNFDSRFDYYDYDFDQDYDYEFDDYDYEDYDYMDWYEEDLDNDFRDLIEENEYEGGSIGIMKNGKLVFAQGYGEIAGRQIHPTTLLPISSLSKTITAVAILQLAEIGYLDLEDTVFGGTGLLRAFDTYEGEIRDRRLLDITVNDLLHHAAGWDETKGPIFDPTLNRLLLARGYHAVDIAQELNVPDVLSQYDLIRYMMKQELQFTPGAKTKYSNFGYLVLGRIIEEVTGLPYEEYITQNIINPAGMKSTRVGPRSFDEFILLNAQFSDEVNSQYMHSLIDPELLDSTLGWYSNTYDMARFSRCLFGRHPECQLLKPESVHYMLERPVFNPSIRNDQWKAISVHVTDQGAVWQDSDINDNDVLLYHQGPQRKSFFNMLTTDFDVENGDNVTVIMLMASNRYKRLRSAAEDYVIQVRGWPDDMEDLMTYDLSDAELKNDRLDIYIRYGLSEHHIVPYLNALKVDGFYPTWMHGFAWDGATLFNVISRKADHPDQLKFEVERIGRAQKMDRRIRYWLDKGYHIDMLQTYESFSHDDQSVHIALFKKPIDGQALQPDQIQWGISVPLEEYFATVDDATANGYSVRVQSIESHGHQPFVTYIFERLGHMDSYVSYHDLSLDRLETLVKANAMDDFHVEYLDSYHAEGEPRFSVIFRQTPNTKWLMQTDVSEDELANQALTWHRMDYVPKVVIGYEMHNHEMRYIGLWLK